jgi:hypothetical protein
MNPLTLLLGLALSASGAVIYPGGGGGGSNNVAGNNNWTGSNNFSGPVVIAPTTGITTLSGVVNATNLNMGTGSISGGGLPISVLAYGASTNSADNTAAIQAAINAATNSLTSFGNTVTIPSGWYICSNTIITYPGVFINGAGQKSTVLYFPSSVSNCVSLSMKNASATNLVVAFGISDLRIKNSPGVTNTGSVISINGQSGASGAYYCTPLLKNLFLDSYSQHLVYITNAIGGTIDNLIGAFSIGDGVLLDGTITALNLRSSYISFCGGYGFNVTNANYLSFTSCASDNNAAGGYHISGFANTLYSCGAEQNGGSSFWVGVGDNNKANAISLIGCYANQGPAGTNALTIDGVAGLSVINPQFIASTTLPGWEIYFTAAANLGVDIKQWWGQSWGLGIVSDKTKCNVYEDLYTHEKWYPTENVRVGGLFANGTSQTLVLTNTGAGGGTTYPLTLANSSSFAGDGPGLVFKGYYDLPLVAFRSYTDPGAAPYYGGALELDVWNSATTSNRVWATDANRIGNFEIFKSLLVDGNQTNLGTLTVSGALTFGSLVVSTNAAPLTNTIVGFFWLTNGANVYKVPLLQ